MVSRLERGRAETMTLGSLRRVVAALGASVRVEVRWSGEQLDRLVDAAHAAIQEVAVGRLRMGAWRSEAEVSFNWYGDRGRCDAVAFHEPTGTLMIVEIKTRLVDLQEMLGQLDVKVRMGPQIARQLGWPVPARVVPCLLVADSGTARRIVRTHPELFARFNLRGHGASRWLADPTSRPSADPVTGLLLFEPLPDSHRVTTRRVDRPRKASNSHRV